MGIRTGRQYIDSLRDGRQMWIDGECVTDVTTDRRFAAAAYTMAELYDMQHDPKLIERMTYKSPSSGNRVGLSFIQPKTVDDLVRRREMVKTWMDATCGMFGRSPDFMNITLTGFASACDVFGQKDKKFSENIWNYYLYCRENDIAMTHTLINPQVDRSKPVEKQDKDLAAKIVKETDAGIVISGARMVSTLCAYSHDLLVMPSTYLANNEEAQPYAFGFSVPVNTAGLRFICRPSVIHENPGSPMDYPLSSRLDETDAMVIFDNVLVPWERVFIHRAAEMCNGLYNRPAAMPLWTVRMMFPKMFIRMCEIIQTLGAGGLVAVPSYAELTGPIGKDVETYFQAANADSRYRIKLFRLAFDAAVSSFSGRQQLYERYYSGDPVRLAATLYDIYDKDPHINRIGTLLDDLEERRSDEDTALRFRPLLSAAE